ncbi:MAG: hypothetical protein JSV06_13615 [Myxococcales bacterium]|nr:MAG: hypothetical protein JSV06_13615 [Myxococcales bacterium]
MPDELSGADRGSTPPSFDFDDDAIASLLDDFVEKQTGPQEKHVSRPPNPDDSGAQAAQRTVFQHTSRHEALPLVGDSTDAKRRRIELLEALDERAMGSARARLLTSAAELLEHLGDAGEATRNYGLALEADARDVVVLRALRRRAIVREDWPAAADALEREASLDLTTAERAATLKLLAQIQLSKLGDAAAAEQAASHAADLEDDDFVAWLLAAGARLVRGQKARAAQALCNAAERWPSPDAQAVILMHAAELMEQAGEADEAKALFAQVLELCPSSLGARLGMIRAARELGESETLLAALRAAADKAPSPVAAALRRTAAVAASGEAREHDGRSLLEGAPDTASLWTLAEKAALGGDLHAAAGAFAAPTSDGSAEVVAVGAARRARLLAELGEPQPMAGTPHPLMVPYLRALGGLSGVEAERAIAAIPAATVELTQSPRAAMAHADDAAWQADRSAFIAALERELAHAEPSLAGGAELAVAEAAGAEGGLGAALRWREQCNSDIEQQPGYLPALWNLEESADSDDARARAAAMQAEADPTDANVHHLRASMWATLPEARSQHAEAALDRHAPDPLLIEHLFESTGTATEAAGDLMSLAARKLDSADYFRRAAESYRAAGLPARAAKALREASDTIEEDAPLRARRKDAELQASEFARLAESAMQRAREAEDEDEELRAFSAMAEVDRLARRDMQSARLSLQSIAEARPEHVPTARALEWDALRERDPERIRSSARRLLQALPEGSADRLARQRLLVELLRADSDILQNDIDRILRGFDEPLEADPGLARQVLGAAYAKNETELGVQALIALQASLSDDLQRAALALEAALLLQRGGDTGRALEALNTAANHPLALEAEARLLRAAKRWEDAAAVYRDAASRAKDGQRAASLWREAACILEEELGASEQSLEAWEAAVNCDITYLDAYRRLAAAYQREGLVEELALLIDARIEAGADTPTLVGLLLDKAAQRRERGDVEGVIDALSECLELDPFHFVALQELVDTHRRQENWQGAAEALIRIARLKRSVDEQVWAFSELAEIYHEHLTDLPRAEASLRRALELAPAHTETLDRLGSVLTEQDKRREAAHLLQELVRRAGNVSEKRDYRIRLATTVERAGDSRQAETMFEQLRGEQPTEPDVILAVADHYARQGASPAESMHLNRAVNDLRDAIQVQPGDEALWTTLVRVLNRKHGPGTASCAASAAIAIGHPASLFVGDVTTRNEALGQPRVPLSSAVDSIVAPPTLPQTVRRLFALCEHSFDKMLPFDAGAWRLRRPSGPHRTLVEEAGAVAEALGVSEPRLRITYIAPTACMPITGDPPTLVVGGNLHEMTTPEERVFLFARSLKVASSHLAPALRARPEELDVALLSLLHGHDPSRPRGEPEQMRELRKKLMKAVPRRWRDEVESLVLELRGNSAFSTRLVPFAVSGLGDRAALTLTGNVPSAVDALLKVAGHDVPAGHAARLDAITEIPEAWALIRFAISDAHFEARAQAGVDP